MLKFIKLSMILFHPDPYLPTSMIFTVFKSDFAVAYESWGWQLFNSGYLQCH